MSSDYVNYPIQHWRIFKARWNTIRKLFNWESTGLTRSFAFKIPVDLSSNAILALQRRPPPASSQQERGGGGIWHWMLCICDTFCQNVTGTPSVVVARWLETSSRPIQVLWESRVLVSLTSNARQGLIFFSCSPCRSFRILFKHRRATVWHVAKPALDGRFPFLCLSFKLARLLRLPIDMTLREKDTGRTDMRHFFLWRNPIKEEMWT